MKYFIIPAFCLLMTENVFTQSLGSPSGQPIIDVNNLIPKSPQADGLEKVNELAVNGSRGVPEISFNLYTASVGGIKIPITISYDASGIKYDDIPSSVGLKWTLQAGGEISRSINGLPDELGYFANAHAYTQEFVDDINPGKSSGQDSLQNIGTNHVDISMDKYAYNYLDRSGYFYFRNYKLLDYKNLYTNKIEADSYSSFYNLKITNDNGDIAYFGGDYTELTLPSIDASGYVTPYLPSSGITAWKLNKIKAYTKEEATFQYDTCNYETNKLTAESYTKRTEKDWSREVGDEGQYYDCNCGTSSLNQVNVTTDYVTQIIRYIHTPNEDIQFFYSNDNSFAIYRKKLDSIVVKDKSSIVVKRIHFQYSKYLTANLLRLDGVWNLGNNNTSDSILIASFHYASDYLDGITSLGRDVFNYYNGAGNSHLIETSDNDYTTYYYNADRSISPYTINAGVLDTIYYPTGGKAAFSYSDNVDGSSYGPGIKVDSIKYLDNNNSIASSIQYSYSGQSGDFVWTGTIYNTEYDNDNSNCPSKNIHSELHIVPPIEPFFYGTIEIRKKSSSSAQTQLTKEFYTIFEDGYITNQPYISERVYFRNNNQSDTLKIEQFTYNEVSIDSLGMAWLFPGNPYLPNYFYGMDNGTFSNDNCSVLYADNAGEYGIIKPKNNLLVSQKIKDFDQSNSSHTLTTTITNTYNDKWQKVSDTKTNSKGDLDSTYYTYLYTNAGSLSTSVTNGNLLGVVNKTNTFTTSNAPVEGSRVSFSSHSSLVLPDSFYIQTFSNDEALNNRISGYDTSGKVIEVDKQGYYTSFIRDYGNAHVIAEATNAQVSDIAYTSFEADGAGAWSGINSSYVVSTPGITGNKYYSKTSFSLSKSGLNSSNSYIVSYWSTSGSYSISGTASGYPKTLNSISRGGNTWTLYEHLVTGQSTISVTGTGAIDELRLHPKDAQMITDTYDPLIGILSRCDASNRISYYEYDAFGRLKYIRDQNQNILKAYDYKYASQ